MAKTISKETDRRVLDWLLEEDQPSVRYQALVDLLARKEGDPEVREARSMIPRAGWARDILRLQKPGGYWEEGEPDPSNLGAWMNFLYLPKYTATNWRALVLSDLGLTSEDRRIKRVAELFFKYKLRVGMMVNIFNEEVCIVGNTARMLTRFGYTEDFRVMKLYERLLEDQKEDGGWHCFESRHGTLDGWEGLAAFAALPRSRRTKRIERSIARGAEFYLERKLFEEGSKKYPPWLRFHYPNHYYYDVLVGLDVITKLGYGHDRRLEAALGILNSKRRRDGTWALDKVHPDLAAGADYGMDTTKVTRFALEEPGRPSKWITLKALQVLKRVEDSS